MTDILSKLKIEAPLLIIDDLIWIIPELLSFYQSKIDFLARKAYNCPRQQGLPGVAKKAFRAEAALQLRSACETFFFKKEHWKTDRPLNQYLLTVLNRLAEDLSRDHAATNRTYSCVCPRCKNLGRKEYLNSEDKLLRCVFCTQELERLLDGFSSKTVAEQITIRCESIGLKVFSLHSRAGYRCPDCSRFLPRNSQRNSQTDGSIACPFVHCNFLGKVETLIPMSHPTGIRTRSQFSLNQQVGETDTAPTFQEMLADEATLDIETQIVLEEKTIQEFKVLNEVIQEQLDQAIRNDDERAKLQKVTMYRAYQEMIKKYPDDLLAHLVHGKMRTDYALHARIFQQYADLIIDQLPMSLIKNKKKINIVELTDPNLGLFLGISTFQAKVSQSQIQNLTTEMYVGSRLFNNYGPCFFGKIIDIIEVETKKSLKDRIKDYSFSEIKMSGVEDGTVVEVQHYRIASHYEVGSLAYLQKVKKNICNRVKKRLS